MWAAVAKILVPIANWVGKIILLPLILEFINKMKEAREEKIKREQAHKEIEDGLEKISNALTPEEQEAALEEFTRKARARRNKS
jgi:hypothetical protein